MVVRTSRAVELECAFNGILAATTVLLFWIAGSNLTVVVLPDAPGLEFPPIRNAVPAFRRVTAPALVFLRTNLGNAMDCFAIGRRVRGRVRGSRRAEVRFGVTSSIHQPGDCSRGQALYDERLRDVVESRERGKFLVLDVETGEYEIDFDEVTALRRAKHKNPDAALFILRVGYPAAYRIGRSITQLRS